jgi:hypothetical protein
MTGMLYINGYDAWTTWGVFLEDGSEDKLLMAVPLKEYIENKSRAQDGKSVVATAPKRDERDVTLVFCFAGNGTSFVTRYNQFMSQLYAGALTLRSVRNKMTYNLLYLRSTALSSMTYAGKVAVVFNEPNPVNRTPDA